MPWPLPFSFSFQLTRSRGAWHARRNYATQCWNFNSHAHEERDLFQQYNELNTCKFQLTRSRGAWLFLIHVAILSKKFQLTRSRGAWLSLVCIWSAENKDFNSHAHEERDPLPLGTSPTLRISTHTLTRSVTIIVYCYHVHMSFQLTRSRGAWRRINKS